MTMQDYECARAILGTSGSDFVGPRSAELVEAAERALGVELSPTYRRFLREFGCGDSCGEEFYGVISEDFDNSGVPDAVWLTLAERRDSDLPGGLVIISAVGDGRWYALDCRRSDGGEAPVILWPSEDLVADSFGTFLLMQVKESQDASDD